MLEIVVMRMACACVCRACPMGRHLPLSVQETCTVDGSYPITVSVNTGANGVQSATIPVQTGNAYTVQRAHSECLVLASACIHACTRGCACV
jgi:hypothetical protein